MNINSEYIQKKEFHVVFKGYKPEEVDKFLDILSVEFDRLSKKNRELQESLDRLKFEGHSEEQEMKKVLQDALVSAHKVAEEIKEKARKEAEEYIKSRKAEEEESYKDLLTKKQELEEKIRYIEDKYEEFKIKVKSMAEDFGQFINKMDSEVKLNELRKVLDDDKAEKGKYLSFSENEGYSDKTFKEDSKDSANGSKKDTSNDEYISKVDEKEKENTEREKADLASGEEQEHLDNDRDYSKQEKDGEIKRKRKGIDIADSDIINEFFRSDEDRDY